MTQTGVVAGGRLTDWISLGVLASWVPADAVDDAIEATGKQAQRRGGKLPPRVVAYLVMALALFADEDYEEVAARLAGTLADWDGWEESWGRVPTSGGITQARQRLGPEPMAELFSQVARPVATMETAGGVPRAVAADEHRRDGLGRPGHPGERGRVRVPEGGEGRVAGRVPQGPGGHGQRVRVARGGAGRDRPLRAQGRRRAGAGPPALPASWRRTGCSSPTAASTTGRTGARRRTPGRRCCGGSSPTSGFPCWRSSPTAPTGPSWSPRRPRPRPGRSSSRPPGPGRNWTPARARHVRVVEYEIPDRDGEDELIALVTTITDPLEAPAAALAAAYHQRWEHETANAQLKTFLRGPGRILRSQSPDMIEQEIWGYLLTHYAISALICTAATSAGIDPDRVKFKRTIRAVRRRVADPAFSP